MLKRFLTAFQEDSKTSGGTETCHTYPTEGLGHLAHATTSGVLLRVVKTCEVEFCSSRIQVGSWYHILIILLTLQYTFQRKHPRLTPFLWNQNQLTPPDFPAWGPVFYRGIESRLNFQSAKAAKAAKAGHSLKHLTISIHQRCQSLKVWKSEFSWATLVRALTPKQHAMQEFSEKFGTQVTRRWFWAQSLASFGHEIHRFSAWKAFIWVIHMCIKQGKRPVNGMFGSGRGVVCEKSDQQGRSSHLHGLVLVHGHRWRLWPRRCAGVFGVWGCLGCHVATGQGTHDSQDSQGQNAVKSLIFWIFWVGITEMCAAMCMVCFFSNSFSTTLCMNSWQISWWSRSPVVAQTCGLAATWPEPIGPTADIPRPTSFIVSTCFNYQLAIG